MVNNSEIICITGMHRSSTSLLANWLYESGVHLGANLIKASLSNAKGHFEDLDFVNLHIKDLLRKKLSGSALLHPKSNLRFDSLSMQHIEKLVRKRTEQYDIWGWKDPRTSLYLNHWMDILPEMKVIMVFRKPEEVIHSLVKREIPRERADRKKYTNPLNVIRSWYLFDFNYKALEKQYLKTYDIYNQQLIDIFSTHRSRCLLIYHDDLIKNNEVIQEKLRYFSSNLKASLSQFSKIYSEELISKPNPDKANISHQSKTYDRLLTLSKI